MLTNTEMYRLCRTPEINMLIIRKLKKGPNVSHVILLVRLFFGSKVFVYILYALFCIGCYVRCKPKYHLSYTQGAYKLKP